MPAALAVAAVVVAAGGALYSGVQAKKQADYNAKVAENEAVAAKNKASYEETIHRERLEKLKSTQISLFGKSGVDMTGSPLLVLEDTAEKGELDALAIRYGGDVEAARARSQATLFKMQGKDAQTASYFKAGSTLLSGASSYAGGGATTARYAGGGATTARDAGGGRGFGVDYGRQGG